MPLVAPIGLDRVWFNPVAGALTDFAYSSALTGFQSPAAAGAVNGAYYSYFAQTYDLSQWEKGIGIWVTSTLTLQRTQVDASSNSNNKVNFSVIPTVAIDCRAIDVANLADVLHAFNGGI